MHWLKEYRLLAPRPGKRGGCGITRSELAAAVRRRGVGCSPKLIDIIEHGGITHPRIANAIAAEAGATPEQRDSMVHEVHRGGWTPPKRRKRSEIKNDADKPQPMAIGIIPETARAVVQLDENGITIARFESLSAAAAAAGKSAYTVGRRCRREIGSGSNEFLGLACTWRFADEWDGMTSEQRSEDMRMARQQWSRKKEDKA